MKWNCLLLVVFVGALGISCLQAQQAPPNPQPDVRYKLDILIVVGHPDDDIEVTSYIAKLIEQHHKRVGVLYGTRGNSGGNAAGPEQAKALADIREMEARRSLASYGITDAWFMHGPDTPGGDVLHSLEAWGHGQALEETVRLFRITRPDVIFTWLPNYVVGENHDDHQAASVLANEAFDLAGDPLAFPEQVEAARDHLTINNYGEGLRPWQPKKIYYFSDTTHFDFFQGNGPEYATSDISPARKISYARIAAEAWGFYKTQNDFTEPQLKEFTEMPVRFIFGKSLVGGSVTGDVFEGVTASPVGYAKSRGYEPPPSSLALGLGGPWEFYKSFWQAHGIEHLAKLYAPEAQVAASEKLWVPLIIRNDTDSLKEVSLKGTLPSGWTMKPEATVYSVGAHDSYAVQLVITAASTAQKDSWQNLVWKADSSGQSIGSVTLRVSVAGNGLPQ
jgi:LmbE family N-acetylglucosaminyl deacetylase